MDAMIKKSADHEPSSSNRAADNVKNAAELVKSALASARDAIVKTTDTARRQARQVAGSTDDFVRLNPWQAVGLAALAGLAVGLLARRRS